MQQCYRLLSFVFIFATAFGGVAARSASAQGTILPTDVVPLAGPQERSFMSDSGRITLLNRLPSRLYINASCETSFRLETNPFQMPTRYDLIQSATRGNPLAILTEAQQNRLGTELSERNASQQIFRALPAATVGWTLTPNTRVYGSYFSVSDTAMQWHSLNSNVMSFGGGVQHDIPLGNRFNLQADFQSRELLQSKQVPVFDYLPSLTLSYAHSERTVAFASTVLQMRGRRPFQAPTREIDPFYSFGMVHRRGKWTFSTFATFVQNFRQPFGSASLIPINNYSWVLDFEIARPVSKRIPSLQAFVRAEPVFNFKSMATPGFSGTDFRLFYGLRMALGKPSLLPINQMVREQLKAISQSKHIRQTPPAEPSGMLTPSQPIQPNAASPTPSEEFTEPSMGPQSQKTPSKGLPSEEVPIDDARAPSESSPEGDPHLQKIRTANQSLERIVLRDDWTSLASDPSR